MLGEIGNITKSNYGFDYSKPVVINVLSTKSSDDNQTKYEQTQFDSYIQSSIKSNTTYNKSASLNSNSNTNETDKTDSNNGTGKTVINNGTDKTETNNGTDNSKNNKTITGEKELKPAEKQEVDDLARIDTSVKTHEQAHMSAGGGLVRGGATYQYQKGPDGKSYAVGGEVQIDISPVSNNPEATVSKMQQVISAALAPADPSGQDKQVASAATQIETQALEEVQQKSVSNFSKSTGKIKIQNETVSKLDKSIVHKYSHSTNLKTYSMLNVLVS